MISTQNTPKPLLAFIFTLVSLCVISSCTKIDAQLMTSGQWRDPDTGLIWMRCSIGQTWTGSTCSGTPIKLSWQDANDYFQLFNQDGFAGKKDWRLPKVEELVTLRRCSNGWAQLPAKQLPSGTSIPIYCANSSNAPTIDSQIFPNTPSDWYWSASLGMKADLFAWDVNFKDGSSNSYATFYYGHVRAVRARQ